MGPANRWTVSPGDYVQLNEAWCQVWRELLGPPQLPFRQPRFISWLEGLAAVGVAPMRLQTNPEKVVRNQAAFLDEAA